MAGLKSARSRGKMGGRPKGLSEEAKKKARIAEALYNQKELTTQEIADQLSISRTTLYEYLKLIICYNVLDCDCFAMLLGILLE